MSNKPLPSKLSSIIQEEIRKGVGRALQNYISVPIDKRQEMEQKGINLGSFVYDEILPVLNNTKIDRMLILMGEGIGNMVMLTPALKALSYNHPRLKITVLCKNPAAQVIQGWDCVDKVITEFDNSYYDLCFVTMWGHGLEEENKVVLQQYCKNQFSASLKTFHEALQHMSAPEFLGATNDFPETHCQMATGKETEKVDKGLEVAKGKKIIIFGDTALRHFGWDVKRWPYYTELAKLIDKKFKDEYHIFMIGDDEDLEEAEEKQWRNNVSLYFMGKLNISQLAYLISKADLYIGNDTGPTHIAAAVGTKTYAIFGPTMVSKNKPLGQDVTILNKRPPCSPCQYTDKFTTCDCLGNVTAQEIYNQIFYGNNQTVKIKTILIGVFSGGALRNEMYIKKTLESKFGHKVITFDYRAASKNQTDITTSYDILNLIMHHEPEYAIICGGQTISPGALAYLSILSPKTKLLNWYVDNKGKVEPWFKTLSAVCTSSFWSTGDPVLLSQVFSQTQKPCRFLPITPDDSVFKPMKEEKTIDVLFVGTPHSKPRVQLLEFLVKSGVNIEIYGDGEWPLNLKSNVKAGLFDKEFVKKLNQAKIVLNINIINHIPLYFSDRYFQPMAVKTVGLNMYIPKLEDMFEDGKHMMFYRNEHECLEKIKTLLKDDAKRKSISEEGYKLYKEKYTLTHMLTRMLEEA